MPSRNFRKRWAALAGTSLAGTAVLAAAMVSFPALADTPAPSAEALAVAAKFGTLDQVQGISLSPDGKHVAVVTPLGGGGTLLMIDVENGTIKGILHSAHKDQHLVNCGWTSSTRLYCRMRMTHNDAGQLIGFTRLIALNADGSHVDILTATGGGIVEDGGDIIDRSPNANAGVVLMTRQFGPGVHQGFADDGGLAVEEVNTNSLNRHIIESMNSEAEEYLSDGHGNVRIMGLQPTSSANGYAQKKFRYFYRPQGGHGWQPLTTIDTSNSAYSIGFQPEVVDGKANIAYGTDVHDGFKALFTMALDGSGKQTLIASHPNVDVDGVIAVGPHARVVGVQYASEKRMVDYFDPELSQLNKALSGALPGHPDVGIWDTSDDENQMLLLATKDTDPGAFYLFDKATHHLGQVLPLRPELAGMTLAEMHSITFTAADGSKIPAYLTLPAGSNGKNLPAIVMPHGGPEARDEWGFDWLVQFFAARGFAVLQPEFRGSTGYGSAWFNKNGFKSWATAIGDVNDAGRWMQAQGIAAPGKMAIFGWSYGGYAALQSQVVDPDLFKAVVAVAPVTDFDKLREERRGFLDFEQEDARIGNGTHVQAGSPARHADRFKAPVLLFHGDKDQNVGIGETLLMRDRLRSAGKQVDFVEFPGLDHQLYDAEARTKMLSTSDAFLRKALGLAP